jgi:HK97 family phage prohead protease
MTSFATDQLQYRAAPVEAYDDDEGTILAQLVEYEREAEVAEGLSEIFTRGAFRHALGNPSRIKVTDQQHNRSVVIGHAVSLEEQDDKLLGKLKVAYTSAGRDVLELLRAGSLSELSIEFRAQRQHMTPHATELGNRPSLTS